MANRYNNRGLSWLSLNERVLQEAQDERVPLLSRLQFLGIFSNNMDEFTKVRIANLMRLCRTRKDRQHQLLGGYCPHDLLNAANAKSDGIQKRFDATYAAILEEMGREGIFVINQDELNDEQRDFCRSYFAQVIAQRLVPLMLRKGCKMPFLPDGNAYPGVNMSLQGQQASYAIVLNQSRAEVIVFALKIFCTAAEKFDVDKIMVPCVGLVDGIVRGLAAKDAAGAPTA